jgi:hypothetical protein
LESHCEKRGKDEEEHLLVDEAVDVDHLNERDDDRRLLLVGHLHVLVHLQLVLGVGHLHDVAEVPGSAISRAAERERKRREIDIERAKYLTSSGRIFSRNGFSGIMTFSTFPNGFKLNAFCSTCARVRQIPKKKK